MIADAHIHIFSHPCPNLTPPEIDDGRFPADRLLALMDREGVDKAVVVQNPTIGTVNEEVAAAVEAHPDRFAGAVQVDPTAPDAAEALRRFASRDGMRALKLEMSEGWGWTGIHSGLRLSDDVFAPLWGIAGELGLRVILDPGPPGNPGYQVEEIAALAARLPHVHFLLEHLGYLTKAEWGNAAARRRRTEMLRLALRPNVYLGFSAVGVLLEEPFPCPRTAELLEEAVALAGAHKILWGTDAPYSLRQYTYGQMLDTVREHPGLDGGSRALILGGNARRLFFLE
jgi:hypothetical protein